MEILLTFFQYNIINNFKKSIILYNDIFDQSYKINNMKECPICHNSEYIKPFRPIGNTIKGRFLKLSAIAVYTILIEK